MAAAVLVELTLALPLVVVAGVVVAKRKKMRLQLHREMYIHTQSALVLLRV
jgi:hypothetical protein